MWSLRSDHSLCNKAPGWDHACKGSLWQCTVLQTLPTTHCHRSSRSLLGGTGAGVWGLLDVLQNRQLSPWVGSCAWDAGAQALQTPAHPAVITWTCCELQDRMLEVIIIWLHWIPDGPALLSVYSTFQLLGPQEGIAIAKLVETGCHIGDIIPILPTDRAGLFWWHLHGPTVGMGQRDWEGTLLAGAAEDRRCHKQQKKVKKRLQSLSVPRTGSSDALVPQ